MTENGSHIEGCVIRLHCVALCSLTEYRSSFNCVDGAITKSLQAMGEIWDKLSGAWAAFGCCGFTVNLQFIMVGVCQELGFHHTVYIQRTG